MSLPLIFEDLPVGELFYWLDENVNWQVFLKLNFNKARNIETDAVNHFPNLTSIWVFE